jgi:hypothetical protein
MLIILLNLCYLQTGECRVEEIKPPPQTQQECSRRAAELAKQLAHSIGDDGWVPMGVSCSVRSSAPP